MTSIECLNCLIYLLPHIKSKFEEQVERLTSTTTELVQFNEVVNDCSDHRHKVFDSVLGIMIHILGSHIDKIESFSWSDSNESTASPLFDLVIDLAKFYRCTMDHLCKHPSDTQDFIKSVFKLYLDQVHDTIEKVYTTRDPSVKWRSVLENEVVTIIRTIEFWCLECNIISDELEIHKLKELNKRT